MSGEREAETHKAEALRATLRAVQGDYFDVGDALRWEAGEGNVVVAVKVSDIYWAVMTPVGASGFQYETQTASFPAILQHLAQAGSIKVTTWETTA